MAKSFVIRDIRNKRYYAGKGCWLNDIDKAEKYPEGIIHSIVEKFRKRKYQVTFEVCR